MTLYSAYRRMLYCADGQHRYIEQHRIDLTTDEYTAVYECRDCDRLYVLTRHADPDAYAPEPGTHPT